MIPLQVTQEQITYATDRMPHVKDNPDTRTFQTTTDKVLWGFIAEIAVCDLYGWPRPEMVYADGGADILLPSGIRIDIKSNRIRANWPKPKYDCRVYRAQAERRKKPDYYIFCSHNISLKTVWVKGVISHGAFYKIATFYGLGDKVTGHTYKINSREEEQFIVVNDDLAPLAYPVLI